MARKYLVSIDLGKNELQNAVVQVLATAPASPSEGQIYYNSVDKKAYIYNGTAWAALDSIDYAESADISGSAVGDSTAAGTSAEVARADHVHGREAFGSVTGQTSFGSSSGNGAATTVSRSDHTHGTPAHDATAHSGIKLSALAAPDADVSLGSQKITNLATPTTDSDAATKGYVDGVAAGLDPKQSVRAATTANITLSGTQTIDGVSVIAGDRVLVKNQSTGADNGIYVVASGSWARSTDFDSSAEASPGAFTFVEEGTANGDTGWVLATNGPITLGTTSLSFTQFNAATSYTAGNGLTLAGSAFAVGAGTGITVNADDVAIDTSVVARKYAVTLSTSATSYTVTHNLGTKDVVVQVFATDTAGAQVECDVEHDNTNSVTIRFATAPSANAYRVIVLG